MDNKLKHLEFIQGVVNRLSTNSFLLKGWSVLLVSALFVLAGNDSKIYFIYLAYFPAIAFWVLDGYFLWQERLFRKLYDHVRVLNDDEIDYSMNTATFISQTACWFGTTFSKTLIIFHGTVIGTILIVMIFVLIFFEAQGG